MSYIAQDAAKKLPCPIARVRGDADKDGNVKSKCSGAECMFWRWRPLDAADPRFGSAIIREQGQLKMEEKPADGDKPKTDASFHKRAVAKVSANLEGYIIRHDDEQGFCGMAGKP